MVVSLRKCRSRMLIWMRRRLKMMMIMRNPRLLAVIMMVGMQIRSTVDGMHGGIVRR